MKFILNKKNIPIAIYFIIALCFSNLITHFNWNNRYSFDWLTQELVSANYTLAYKAKEKAGLSEFDNYRLYFNEDITDDQLSNLLLNNDLLFDNSFVLDDPNIKYIIKDFETNTTVTNTYDITNIDKENYDDHYLYFITFMFNKEGQLSYNTSHTEGFDWYTTIQSYKSNYFSHKGLEIDENLNNPLLYNANLNNLKNITISYAISYNLVTNSASYEQLHPFIELKSFIYNELTNYIIVIFIISFIINYNKIWFYVPLTKSHPIHSFVIIITMFIFSYSIILDYSILKLYSTNNYNLLIISLSFLFFIIHLIAIYLRSLSDKYLMIQKWKDWFNNNISNKITVDQDALDINRITKHINISKSQEITLKLVSILTTTILITSIIIANTLESGYSSYIILILFFCLYFVFYKYIHTYFIQYDQLVNTIKRVSNGCFDNDMQDLSYFKDLQEEFSHIKEGFEKAVLEEVKSERMKTELITNVSHDLKTPLTSIITYIDLLKKDNTMEEQKNYLSILERSSLRLKRLIEDLFEVSKANSGNIELNIESIDIVSLIKQVQFEYSDKLEMNNLSIKENFTKDKHILKLDSLKTFRIFENLINNAIKYAMPNTRIYIDIQEQEHSTTITIKNISYQEMNFTGEEIVERFVRGDKSRNTNGSGLGLAIVKSFTEVQNGEFKVDIDGDLFKAIIIFKK